MKHHKLRNILLITLGLIVIAGTVCGYVFRREIKFYYTSYKIEQYNKKRYGTQRVNMEEVFPKKEKEYSSEEEKRAYLALFRSKNIRTNSSVFADDDLSYFWGHKYMSKFALVNTEQCFTDHSDDPYVCKKCFLSNGYDKEKMDSVDAQIMLFENSAAADTLYNYYKERKEQANWESKWEYVHADPVSFYKYIGVTEYNRCFFNYEYYPHNNKIILNAIYIDEYLVTDIYYYGECGEDLNRFLDALDSACVPVTEEIRGIPDNIPPREE